MEFAEKPGFEHQDKSSLVVFASREAMRELVLMQQPSNLLASFCVPVIRRGRETTQISWEGLLKFQSTAPAEIVYHTPAGRFCTRPGLGVSRTFTTLLPAQGAVQSPNPTAGRFVESRPGLLSSQARQPVLQNCLAKRLDCGEGDPHPGVLIAMGHFA